MLLAQAMALGMSPCCHWEAVDCRNIVRYQERQVFLERLSRSHRFTVISVLPSRHSYRRIIEGSMAPLSVYYMNADIRREGCWRWPRRHIRWRM